MESTEVLGGQTVRKVESTHPTSRRRLRGLVADTAQVAGPESIPRLIQVLEDEIPRHEKLQRKLLAVTLMVGMIAVVGISILVRLGAYDDNGEILFLLCCALIMAIYTGDSVALGRVPTRAQRAAALSLASMHDVLDDVRAVGPLLEAQAFWFGGMLGGGPRKSATLALIRLLPRLTADDAAGLNRRQRVALDRAVVQAWTSQREPDWADSHNPMPAFHASVLSTLEQMPDSSITPALRELAKMNADSPGREAVRYAAQECLLAIQLRATR